jgi:hypothetical protein
VEEIEPFNTSGAKESNYEQLELFPSITENESDQVQVLLEQYCFMKGFIKEFEENGELLYQTDIEGEKARRVFQDETRADKTANAVILHEIRKWKYNQFKMAVTGIDMSFRMIRDEEAQDAIDARYFKGMKPMRAMQQVNMSKGTFGRRLDDGIESISNSLKLMELLDRIKWTY